jgi:hypothetical protein
MFALNKELNNRIQKSNGQTPVDAIDKFMSDDMNAVKSVDFGSFYTPTKWSKDYYVFNEDTDTIKLDFSFESFSGPWTEILWARIVSGNVVEAIRVNVDGKVYEKIDKDYPRGANGLVWERPRNKSGLIDVKPLP